MQYDVTCEKCHKQDEIEKPMRAPLPRCAHCGGTLRRLFIQPPPVHYLSAGFFSTDIKHLQAQVGAERFAQFEAQRDDTLRRARAGRLTGYEKVLEREFGEKTNTALAQVRK